MLLTHEAQERRLGLILAFGTLIWTGTYNALAKGLTPFLSPITLLILSEALTAMFIVMTFGLVPLLREFMKMDKRSIRICILYGLLNSAIAPLFWFTGLKYTSAINASILSSADIVCILIASQLLLGERMTRMQGWGLCTIITGLIIVNIAGVDASFNVHLGDFLILAGSFASGAGAVLYKKYLSHVMPELAIAIRNVAAVVTVSVIALFLHLSIVAEVAAFPLHKVLLLLAFTFFSRYLNLAFFYEALDRLPVTTFSLIQIANPLSGLVFAYLLLGETIHSYQILGCAFIIVGLLVEQMSPKSMPSLHFLSFFSHFHWTKRPAHIHEAPLPLIPKNV